MRGREATPTSLTVMIVLRGLAIVECEISGHRSAVSLADQMNRSFRLIGLSARAEIRGGFVVVREI